MREVVVTKDGSHTIAIPESSVTYHSLHGAIQESRHVFIEAGLLHIIEQRKPAPIAVFEMGFGTGLNAFLTAIQAVENKCLVHYTAIETAPLSLLEIARLNYTETLGYANLFQQLHQCEWNVNQSLNDFFFLHKIETPLSRFEAATNFQVIYYDAFAPSAQPELWTPEVFAKLYTMLQQNGLLVTYCAKGDVKRALQAAGFTIQKLPGPPGKREMLRALKEHPV